MDSETLFLIIGGAILFVLVVLLFTMYVKAPPSIAYVLSGIRKEPRILIGTGGFKIPFLNLTVQ